MKLVAVVPVRGGSKGLPGKNLATLAGVPLWERAVAQGREVGAAEVLVTTDITDILSRDPMPGLTLLERPAELARDDTPMAPVLLHALAHIEGQARIVLLQATSPLRSVDDIRSAVALHESGAFDLVKTVTPTNPGVLKYGRMDGVRFVPLADPAFCFANRQGLPPVMRPNGAAYVFDKDWFLANGGFVTDRIGAVVMPEDRAQDIDTAEDFARAEAILRG
ncbi:acylneuraminate cytidylyltransferase family protein [Silicimonas algicola]|uniref:N-acylneuraminate cytidylyltransferase n=1 Tax=Silicimonas algicola TaxID=1826607 RepID=A0A316GDT8_9RHOB|nr:acylneuraminate cytidylyltransferase family protein [Silicimonas algicola]AZQ66531.1 acylneuraminate cytidylyltransferase family protein [Silicimonas algicola]PWK58872.1 N-acylneuraminate cytidylyltransferase [Silicimonas algicola]